MKEILKYAFMFLALAVCQIVVFNHICLFGFAIPLVFIYFIIKLPVNLGVNWAMTFSFLLGLTIDIFANTQGMNALACTILAALQVPVLNLYLPRQDDLGNPEPSVRTLGAAVFMKYSLTMTAVYCMMFFIIEAFAFFDVARMLLKIVNSTALTFVIILAIEGLTGSRRK